MREAPGVAAELEHRPVPEHRLVLVAAQDEPRAAAAARAALLDPPAARHPQVAAEHEAALEAQQRGSCHRLDRLERAAVQPLDEILRRGPRMRGLDLEPLAGQHLEPLRRPLERIALWHIRSVVGLAYLRDMTGRFIGIRWWLGAAFAVVAAVSTSIVVAQFSSRSQNALRAHAAEQAAQSAALAAKDASIAGRRGSRISSYGSTTGPDSSSDRARRCRAPSASRRSSATPSGPRSPAGTSAAAPKDGGVYVDRAAGEAAARSSL